MDLVEDLYIETKVQLTMKFYIIIRINILNLIKLNIF